MSKPRIELYFFGNSRIVFNGINITNKLSTKSVGILFYVSVVEYISREKLAYLFWEDSEAESAKYNLRYNIWRMNKVFQTSEFKEALIVSEPNRTYISDAYDVYIDVNTFKDTTENVEDLLKLRVLYNGDFLEGFYIKNCYQFNDWLFYQRESYQKKYIEILNKLLDNYKSSSDYSSASDLLEEMIRLNPLDEEYYNELIRMYIDCGDRHSALKQYNRCIHMLREELNLSPKESTLNLLRQIKSSSFETNNSACTQLFHMSHFDAKAIKKSDVYLQCMPNGYNYFGLHHIVDSILKIMGPEMSIEFGELGRIHTEIPCKTEKTLTPETERLLIYHSFYDFIKSSKQMIHLLIDNLHCMDDYSYEGLKFVLMKGVTNCKIQYTCDVNSRQFKELSELS